MLYCGHTIRYTYTYTHTQMATTQISPRRQDYFKSLYVETAEIAERAGVTKAAVQIWIYNGKFPTPDAIVGRSMLWERNTIEPYIRGYEAVRTAREGLGAQALAAL
jgi:hypothetical protein